MRKEWSADYIEAAKEVFNRRYTEEPTFLVQGELDGELASEVVCHVGERQHIVEAIRELFDIATEQARALEAPKPVTITIHHPNRWIDGMNMLLNLAYSAGVGQSIRTELYNATKLLHDSIKE